ncbi:Monoterpene epsilon-lactone hydrolase [Roseovarius gaetbuli]|uniref:Monoterpene epsilon-lactone hydrolase n=1 Tax=Roseovarius gaetbuli TaxID=1356575 RepID=A0A1X7AC35_9RHOB|nr:alpha/beta hydrolase [Roseovarius gaetbuli]SLN75705.1 Monoterpene epsilon-lactone hydrolase [Roseovarius gaetbuli]
MSLICPVLNLWLRITEKPHLAHTAAPVDLRKSFERKARLFFRAPRGTVFREDVLVHEGKEVPVQWAIAPGTAAGPVLLYFHGGGYVFGSSKTHRAMLARLSALCGLPACLPDYRLAPEHVFPAAVEDALTAYRAIADHPGGVILGGDSAGGGLALALLGEITRLGLARPLGCFAFSPLTDLTFSGESLVQNAKADVVLPASRAPEMGRRYLAGADADDPRASPLNADFKGAPPVWLAVGSTEILLDDTRRMAARLDADGVAVDCRVEHDLPHVWPLFQGLLPEAMVTLRQVAGWIKALSSRPDES